MRASGIWDAQRRLLAGIDRRQRLTVFYMQSRVLVIDDSLTLREFIQRTLASLPEPPEVILAEQAREGLALAGGRQPDLILLDYVLPDMNGDEVCRELKHSSRTSMIPVVLMSSDPQALKEASSQNDLIVKTLPKPFTEHSLLEAVTELLGAPPERRSREEPSHSQSRTRHSEERVTPLLSGHTGQISIINLLLAIEDDQLNGVLKVEAGGKKIELHVSQGRPLFVTFPTNRDYLEFCQPRLTGEQRSLIAALSPEDPGPGTPLSLWLAARGAMDIGAAEEVCQAMSFEIFSRVWTAFKAPYQFIDGAQRPPWTQDLPPYDGTISDWALESLRYVEAGCHRDLVTSGGENGIAAYSRKGYDRIQQLLLNEEEAAFARLVGPNRTLTEIAAILQIEMEEAQKILFRFLALEVFDYWPSECIQSA